MPEYSLIVPVYNRPDEVEELLQSLIKQTHKDFEVLIIEDGSTLTCETQVTKFQNDLDIQYFFKENSGQGFSRNYGFERAKGNWLIVFDSDCLIPSHYLQAVDDYVSTHTIDAFGGPDSAHKSFTAIQKSISYSMTSFLTTGGIRGGKKHVGTFHPRSFNMGITKQVFEKTKGYILPRKGEDIEFSLRIIEQGFKTALIEDAFVFHKRRANFSQFFRQLHFFGTARINVYRFYKSELKIIHFIPSIFLVGLVMSLLSTLVMPRLGYYFLAVYAFYFTLILMDAIFRTKSLKIGLLSVISSIIQLTAYGMGLMKEGYIYLRKG